MTAHIAHPDLPGRTVEVPEAAVPHYRAAGWGVVPAPEPEPKLPDAGTETAPGPGPEGDQGDQGDPPEPPAEPGPDADPEPETDAPKRRRGSTAKELTT